MKIGTTASIENEAKNSFDSSLAQVLNAKGRFIDETYNDGTMMKKIPSTYNYMFFVREGKIRIAGTFVGENSVIEKGNFFILSCDQECRITVEEKAHLVVFKFISIIFPYSIPFFQELAKKKDNSYKFTSLPINSSLENLLQVVSNELQSGFGDYHFHQYCHGLLYIIFRQTYSPEQLLSIYYNIIGENLEFRSKVLQNYPQARNVHQLADLVGMSKTAFFNAFSQEFGMNAKKWLIEKKKDYILMNIVDPSVTVKELMFRCGFNTPSNFTRFFLQNFHCTPTFAVKNKDKLAPEIYNSTKNLDLAKDNTIIIGI